MIAVMSIIRSQAMRSKVTKPVQTLEYENRPCKWRPVCTCPADSLRRKLAMQLDYGLDIAQYYNNQYIF